MTIRMICLATVLTLFTLLTTVALVDVGYLGIIEPHFRSWGAAQVFADLVIIALLACVWMVNDARTRGHVVVNVQSRSHPNDATAYDARCNRIACPATKYLFLYRGFQRRTVYLSFYRALGAGKIPGWGELALVREAGCL